MMNEMLKDIIPVITQAIESGSTVAIWYLICVYVLGFFKLVINWTFVLLISKGIYSLIKRAIDLEHE